MSVCSNTRILTSMRPPVNRCAFAKRQINARLISYEIEVTLFIYLSYDFGGKLSCKVPFERVNNDEPDIFVQHSLLQATVYQFNVALHSMFIKQPATKETNIKSIHRGTLVEATTLSQ